MSVRAAIGWLEGIGVIGVLCCAFWLLSPALRAMVGPGTMLQYAATLIACGSAIYFVSVLLGTFLDDQWRTWGTMLTSGGLWWLFPAAGTPDLFPSTQAMSETPALIKVPASKAPVRNAGEPGGRATMMAQTLQPTVHR